MLAVMEALQSATEAGKRVTSEASDAFQGAKAKLLQYRARVHPGLHSLDATINERMTRAKTTDMRHLELFNQLKEKRGINIPEDSPRKSKTMGTNFDELSNSAVLSASQSSSHQRGTLPTTVQEPRAGMSLDNMAPHLPVSSSLSTPLPLTCVDLPPNVTNVAPTPDRKVGNGTIQRSLVQPGVLSNALPRSAEKEIAPTQSQTKHNRPSRDTRTPKPSLKSMPSKTKTRQPSTRTTPGAFPEMPLDVDISSWVLVSPVSSVEVWKISWFKRLFT